jgi:hypothetical protein
LFSAWKNSEVVTQLGKDETSSLPLTSCHSRILICSLLPPRTWLPYRGRRLWPVWSPHYYSQKELECCITKASGSGLSRDACAEDQICRPGTEIRSLIVCALHTMKRDTGCHCYSYRCGKRAGTLDIQFRGLRVTQPHFTFHMNTKGQPATVSSRFRTKVSPSSDMQMPIRCPVELFITTAYSYGIPKCCMD